VRRTFLGAVVGGAAALAVPRLSRAAQSTFPKKPIKIIVTADAGGGEDTEARGIAPYVQKHLGVSVLIENQPGAGGKIAFEKFQRTEPDGYTLITFKSDPISLDTVSTTMTGAKEVDHGSEKAEADSWQ